MYGYSDIYVTMYLKVTKQNAAFIALASGCFSGSKWLHAFAVTGSIGAFVSSLQSQGRD